MGDVYTSLTGMQLPAIGLMDRASDSGEVLKIVGWAAQGTVGDYFGANGLMTPNEALAVNLRGGAEVQRIRVATNASGLYTWTYPIPFAPGVVPVIECSCEGPDPQNGTVVNVQIEGIPTNTSCKIRVNRSTTTIQVLGISVLSLATSVATIIHATARTP